MAIIQVLLLQRVPAASTKLSLKYPRRKRGKQQWYKKQNSSLHFYSPHPFRIPSTSALFRIYAVGQKKPQFRYAQDILLIMILLLNNDRRPHCPPGKRTSLPDSFPQSTIHTGRLGKTLWDAGIISSIFPSYSREKRCADCYPVLPG